MSDDGRQSWNATYAASERRDNPRLGDNVHHERIDEAREFPHIRERHLYRIIKPVPIYRHGRDGKIKLLT
jgi:hypothetical protein